MKKLLITIIVFLSFNNIQAQLPNGSIAPDFTLVDLNGTTHTLYDYLDNGYTVFLDFSAVWCNPCWNYHTSGALEDLYINHGPSGLPNVNANTTNDVMVFFIEGDGNTVAQLNGGSGSVGDWVAGTPYPIICTDGSPNSTAVAANYALSYWPTVYQICSNRLLTACGQTATPYSLITSCSPSSVSFCEDFESLSVGDPIAETSPSWNTWGELMSGVTAPFTDDAIINSTQSSSGSNSLYFPPTAAAGPQDILLMFDPTPNITQTTLSTLSTPYVAGDFTFSQMMYVSSGAGAYFNFQAENIPGTSWALEVAFDTFGDIIMSNTSGTSFTTTFPLNAWFEIKFNIDLSNNNWEVLINGVSQGSFTNSINQIAFVDFYPRIGDEFYVDDVCYSYTPATLTINNGQVSNISTIAGLVGQTRYPSLEIRNFGTDPIYSCDITFNYNGSQITENLTNINPGFGLGSLATMQVDFANSITLIAGTNTGTTTISNVNGAPVDDDPSDDIMTAQITAITPAAGKLVIGEEATGTWCGWCPRGAVALNWMDHDYEGYWQGIAVHNGDPMTDPDYDNGLAPYIAGYPSGMVDRGSEIDPSAFKQDFLQRIVIPPHAFLLNSAQINGNILSVSICLDFQDSINGNWKFACAIVEDSVTGTGSQYYQNNSYSGGTSLIDVDGSDWNQNPGSVPASQMIYRHVARSIAPSFTGNTLPLAAYNIGDQEFITLTFTLNPSWDQSQISIVGMLFDDQGNIDNASSSKLYDAINNLTPCAPSWNCIGPWNCQDPGNGTGAYASLSACQSACMVTEIQEHSTNKELLKVTDILGRETKGTKNEVLFYIYNDGTVEKKIIIE